MTKSQNTKNEQLTEQWKKGELPSGEYYIETKGDEEVTIEKYFNGFQSFDWNDNKDIEQVLAPVPSYEEYLSLTYAKEEDEKIIAEYEAENTKLKERNDSLNNRDINLCRIANGIRDENFSLKELLKECINYVDRYVAFSVVQGNKEREVKSKELLDKINEALKCQE